MIPEEGEHRWFRVMKVWPWRHCLDGRHSRVILHHGPDGIRDPLHMLQESKDIRLCRPNLMETVDMGSWVKLAMR